MKNVLCTVSFTLDYLRLETLRIYLWCYQIATKGRQTDLRRAAESLRHAPLAQRNADHTLCVCAPYTLTRAWNVTLGSCTFSVYRSLWQIYFSIFANSAAAISGLVKR